ncbi:unnamed protein product [Darwinula stevensoni]|uniref:Uncharacterized protein n=1 Tax=Darwinula stevensoni TaxID=69355 RepID=A0A7R8X8L5_9CRUS|nr:unnamed protein product [Darwinula stevensoni]CAG0889794.1 unnamed protein product [Darwinula stevensoni]
MMASPNVIVAKHEVVQINYCCGTSTVTVRTAKIVMITGWVLLLLGIAFAAIWIVVFVSAKRHCDNTCQFAASMGITCDCQWNHGRIVGLILSAQTKMPSQRVLLADHEAVQLNYCCGTSTVTVQTAKRIMIAGFLIEIFGLIFFVLTIVALLTPSGSGSFLFIIGGVLTAQRGDAAIKALKKSKRNAPPSAFPSIFQIQQVVYEYPGNV